MPWAMTTVKSDGLIETWRIPLLSLGLGDVQTHSLDLSKAQIELVTQRHHD